MNKLENKESGLPDISLNNNRRNPIVMILMFVMIILCIFSYFYNRSDKKPHKPEEEVYSIETSKLEIPNHEKIVQENSINEPAKTREINSEITQEQIALIQEKQKELQQRLSAPLMLVNANQSNNETRTTQSQVVSKDANTKFMNQLSVQSQETTHATTIESLNSTIAEGSLIHAILESATNSDLPGYLRASVSEPVYSEDGTQILIPRGSRLIGQYKSGMLQGQSRIFVVWTRLITPNGVSVQLSSAGVDSLGVAGMGADEINRHFWERFGTASLLSLIGAGAANVGVNGDTQENSASSYRGAIANSFAQSADQSLQQESMISPTLKTYQGKPIMVFVARDLNFQNAMQLTKPKINVY